MKTTIRTARAAGFAALVAVLGGAGAMAWSSHGAGTGTRAGAGANEEGKALVSSAAVADPAVADGLSPADDAAIARAEQNLIRDCMAKAGFTYFPFGARDGQPPAQAPGPGGQNVEQARADGFGGPDAARGSEPADDNSRYLGTLSAADQARYQQAEYGDPADQVTYKGPDGAVVSTPRLGCTSAAESRLYGSAQDYLRYSTYPGHIMATAAAATEAAPSYQHAQQAWLSCIHADGYGVKTPGELRRAALAPYAKPGGDTPGHRADEVRMAVAGAQCDVKAELTATHDRLEQGFIDQLTAQDAAGDEGYREAARRALAGAREVVG